jgi:adenosylcobinamide kinase / adenosylcobinamide-phosphate guanylyltransferase
MSESSTKEFIFVMGGARSGKSSWALRYAEEHYGSYIYLATAEILDEEMAERVRLHRESRSAKWGLVEEPLMIGEALETKCAGVDAVLIDCLTVWLSNVLLKMGDEQVATYENSLFEAISRKKQTIIAVANEVGTGVVPEYALGRKFRDLAGSLNQRMAGMADKVFYMIAGLPMCLKGNQD